MRRAPLKAGPGVGVEDPPRLLQSSDAQANVSINVGELLRGYARQTRPGERATAASWYRLRRAFDTASVGDSAGDGGGAKVRAPRGRWAPAFLSGVLTAALALLFVVRVVPSHAGGMAGPSKQMSPADRRGGSGLGGAPGWVAPGHGGTEGASGRQGLGETAAAEGPLPDRLPPPTG